MLESFAYCVILDCYYYRFKKLKTEISFLNRNNFINEQNCDSLFPQFFFASLFLVTCIITHLYLVARCVVHVSLINVFINFHAHSK